MEMEIPVEDEETYGEICLTHIQLFIIYCLEISTDVEVVLGMDF